VKEGLVVWGWVGDGEGSFSWSWSSWVGIEGSEADSGEAAGEEGEEGGVEGFFCLVSGREEGQRGVIEVMDSLSRERMSQPLSHSHREIF
jgi:hypothetical protein